MAQIQAYAYSESSTSTKYRSVCRFGIEEQPSSPTVTYAQLSAPAQFVPALDLWRAIFDATTPAGLYAITYSATTRRVTIASTNATNFKPVFVGNIASFLGFGAGPFAFATSHVGTATPAGVLELVGAETEAPVDAAQVSLDTFRHGRAQARLFGNHQLSRCNLLYLTSVAPSDLSYVTTGRVRLFPTSDTGAYSLSNLDGYVDGYVVEQPSFEPPGDDGLVEGALLLAVER